jgi:Uma2 family endonuclease
MTSIERPPLPERPIEDLMTSTTPATYDDLLRAPADQSAELIAGTLYLFPRPSLAHAAAASELIAQLIPLYRRTPGQRGGWRFLVEPELHLRSEGSEAENVLVPDIAGWRADDLEPGALQGAFASTAPTWVCEVLSPSTARYDRAVKRELYRKLGVPYLWLVDVSAQVLEVFAESGGAWRLTGTYGGDAVISAVPFVGPDVFIDLSLLWDTGEST